MNRLEFICTMNHGRSPVAQRLAENYLAQHDVPDVYVASSGTHVDSVRNNTLPNKTKLRMIQKGAERTDVYDSSDYSIADEILQTAEKEEHVPPPYQDSLDALYHKAFTQFEEEEAAFRDEALRYFNIDGEVKQEGEQTVAQPDARIVWPFEQKHLGVVHDIYKPTSYNPQVQTLGEYIGEADVPNSFGKTKEAYFEGIATLTTYVPRAMEKALTER